jgi:LacI family transcriptional regulator
MHASIAARTHRPRLRCVGRTIWWQWWHRVDAALSDGSSTRAESTGAGVFVGEHGVQATGREAVTLQQVAAAAEVHVSTVSRALDPAKASLVSEATRVRVAKAVEDLGYRPHLIASQLRRGQTHTVGVVVPELDNPLYAPLVRGVTHSLEQQGYMPLVADTQDDHDRLRRIMAHLWNRRVDAIITSAPRVQDREAIEDVAAQGTPVVLVVRTLPGSGLPTIAHDDRGGGRLAAEHLINLGHRRLLQLKGPQDVTPFINRARGFAEAARKHDVELATFDECAQRPTVDEGFQLMMAALARHEVLPTGVFVHNDVMALGALDALRNAGLWCPDDLSVVAYNDNFYAAHARPSLTSLRLPSYDMGQLAGAMAIDHIERPDDAKATAATYPVLLKRESTGPPPTP